MRRRLIAIHLYLGLLLAPYLVIYGVSSIAFNHGVVPRWQVVGTRSVALGPALEAAGGVPGEAGGDPAQRARALRDALGLVGRVPPSRVEEPEPGLLHFVVQRPGREDRVSHRAGEEAASVEARSRGLLGVLMGLHGFQGVEGSRLAPLWSAYAGLSIWALGLFALSGLWLRLSRPGTGRAALLLGSGSAALVALAWGIL